MTLKQDLHVFAGMQKDLAISKQKAEFLWDAHNIRLTAREGSTLLAITNERGTTQITSGTPFVGTYLGHCVMNNYLVIFTTSGAASNGDYIYRVNKNNNYSIDLLYQGTLNFDVNYPIETLGIYENEMVQKVYWVDGINQPRVINIVREQLRDLPVDAQRVAYTDSSFDFVRELALNETVKVTRQAASGGMLQSGVIQYAITYYDKYGQESNIAYVTPLQYIAFDNRGGSPEEKVSVAFKLDFSNLDSNFDYVRIYSIYRSSLNGTPVVKRLTDIPIVASITSAITHPSYIRTDEVIYVKEDVNALEQPLTHYTSNYYYTGGMSQQKSGYKKFTKTSYPNLELHIGNRVVTFGSGATELWISPPNTPGPGNSSQRIIHANGQALDTYVLYRQGNVNGMSYIDNGTQGDNVDPTSLLYVGGEDITASTITQKDGTLFLGNLRLRRPSVNNMDNLPSKIVSSGSGSRTVKVNPGTSNYYSYKSLLVARDNNGFTANPAGFKVGERYRFGIQFQYKTGKWSDPIWLKDDTIARTGSGSAAVPYLDDYNGILGIPNYTITINLQNIPAGYKRARGVVVFPTLADRTIVAQGVATPTVSNIASQKNGIPTAQSSWFFRPTPSSAIDDTTNNGTYANLGSVVEYRPNHLLTSFGDRGAEIQGVPEFNVGSRGIDTSAQPSISFPDLRKDHSGNIASVATEDAGSLFVVNRDVMTFHSPDVEFDDAIDSLDMSNLVISKKGYITFTANMGDISIQTSTPPIHPDSAGFVHRSLKNTDSCRILCAGLFYSDYLVDEYNDGANFCAYSEEDKDCLFMVYPWQKSGSLNNDIVRPVNGGTRSSVLSQKKISNLRFAGHTTWDASGTAVTKYDIQLFSSDQVTLLKLGSSDSYYGNVDTVLSPISDYSVVFCNGDQHDLRDNATPSFTAHKYSLLFFTKDPEAGKGTAWHRKNESRTYSTKYEVAGKKAGHIGDSNGALATSKEAIRMKYKSTKHIVLSIWDSGLSYTGLPIFELVRHDNASIIFGGTSEEAKRSNVWLPAGEPVAINRSGNTVISYDYGDTWYQRYDCLKTYPFTLEDENSITEIGSFLLETRVNIDGRYDKNRGQASNLVTTPRNFNLMNMVYSQPNNFFSYRILDSDYYKLDNYQSSLTWSLNKQAASVVDSWTKITLSNILDCDGNMGAITALTTVGESVFCFQESGISKVMFNSRVQIPTSDGVPIEIANNYKVDGNLYISDHVGSKNKWAMTKSNDGLYFIDSTEGGLFYLTEKGLTNVGTTKGFSSWFEQVTVDKPWTPSEYSVKLFYDKGHRDTYVSTQNTCLNYSEILGQFVSFFSYENIPAMFNIGADFYALKPVSGNLQLWKLFDGDYNEFFGSYQPFDFTFISNSESAYDKIFTNVDMRADFYSTSNNVESLASTTCFDYIRAWNEYQDTGEVPLTWKNAKPSNAKKKMRVWRLDIPRDATSKLDRIRNTWTKISLGVKNNASLSGNKRVELHDVSVQYYI